MKFQVIPYYFFILLDLSYLKKRLIDSGSILVSYNKKSVELGNRGTKEQLSLIVI